MCRCECAYVSEFASSYYQLRYATLAKVKGFFLVNRQIDRFFKKNTAAKNGWIACYFTSRNEKRLVFAYYRA